MQMTIKEFFSQPRTMKRARHQEALRMKEEREDVIIRFGRSVSWKVASIRRGVHKWERTLTLRREIDRVIRRRRNVEY